MAHKKIIDPVKKQGQVTIKDLDEFLRFVIYEYDMRTFDANYISILIPMQFDIDKVFGLNAEYAERPSRLCAGWRPRRYLHHQHQTGIAGKAQAEGSR